MLINGRTNVRRPEGLAEFTRPISIMGDCRMIAAQIENTQALICRIITIFLQISLPKRSMCVDGNASFLCLYKYSALLAEHPIKITRAMSPDEVGSILNNLSPDPQYKPAFLADLHLLTNMVCCLFDCSSVSLRLAPLDQIKAQKAPINGA
jgi:hypothetical protein